ncbi:MAG TPA: PQQ-binding-like beta-propeller repeat protein [Planctomycetota bacterium]
MLAPLQLLATLALLPVAQTDWPHLRGPNLDGSVEAPELDGGSLAPRLAWRKALGPAYSGVVVADGLVVTTFSDGTQDQVIALEAEGGAERWRFALEQTYLGHDGSEDGPIATPTLGAGRAFAISARGRLVALALADGKLQWSKDLPAELGTVVPEYGFGSTPLLEGGLLIVQAGGIEGRYLCAFDPASGALRWAQGEGPLAYGSPIAMDLAGRRQVVVLAGPRLYAVAPESGALLWEHALGERATAENGVATALDGERFCVNVRGEIVVYGVTRAGAGFAVSERARVRELGRTYAAPVFGAGRLWGFKSDFLTCCDAESGARRWKSRPPGGRGLIRVGQRLVVYGAQGVLAVVGMDDGDYRELATLPVLESSGYVWPSFAGGRAYLRNAAELVCVELAPARGETLAAGGPASVEAEASAPAEAPGELGRFLRELEGAADRPARVAAFLAEHTELPLVEPGWVHFLYQGEAEDVAVAGSMLDGSRPAPLARVAGTDLWHASFPIEPGARWEYRFQVDYGDWKADPRNPRTVPSSGPPLSELVTPGHDVRTHFLPRVDGPRGRLEPFEWASTALGATRTLQVYLPAGYDAGSEPYPLLLVHQGAEWIEAGGLVNTLDHVLGQRAAPLVAVFIPALDEWWFEGGGTGTEAYLDALADELVPLLEGRYRLAHDPAERALLGKESFGLTAVLGVLARPETFGKAGVLSVALGDRARHTLFALLEEEKRGELLFFVGWNRYEARNRDRGYDYRAESRRLADALRTCGYAVAGGERLDAHGWGSFRARTDELLAALFPLE